MGFVFVGRIGRANPLHLTPRDELSSRDLMRGAGQVDCADLVHPNPCPARRSVRTSAQSSGRHNRRSRVVIVVETGHEASNDQGHPS
jgi:hypothetical protein